MTPPRHITPPPATVIRPMQAAGNNLVLAVLGDYSQSLGWDWGDTLPTRKLTPRDIREMEL